ncbi:MAG TPA: amidohydrolase family protein [Gemmatimonadaceae bacterium]|nr:amidohydrolase family protein [Gemmatimonadaceae bacterium]
MRLKVWYLLLLAPLAPLAPRSSLQQALRERGPFAVGTYAVTGVNLIPMTSDSVVSDATVLVRDGRIVAAGRNVNVPPGTRRIEASGKYVIPGLADLHTHLYSDDAAIPDSVGAAELGVMLATGITTARLMIGTPTHLELRDSVRRGAVLGPQLWVASPHLVGREMPNGIVVTDEGSARAAVRAVADSGYDQVKITLFITRPVYDAIIDEAAKKRIPVVGHVDPQIGVARALETGQQLEHLDSYLEAVLADSAPSRTSLTQQFVFQLRNWASMDFADDRKIAQIAGATARAGAWIEPTLNVFNTAFAAHESDSAIRSRPDWNMIPPSVRNPYLQARERYWSAEAAQQRTDARRRRYIEVRNRLVKAIHDSGGRILAGSDTPEWFHVYGWGLHRELEAMVQAGLTPYQALATATKNPAEFLGQSKEWGTIERGKRADFILLDANPLSDIRNTLRIDAVVFGGRYMDNRLLATLIDGGRIAIGGAAR